MQVQFEHWNLQPRQSHQRCCGAPTTRAGGLTHNLLCRLAQVRDGGRTKPALRQGMPRERLQPVLIAGVPAATWLLSDPTAATASLMLLSAVIGFSVHALLQPFLLHSRPIANRSAVGSAADRNIAADAMEQDRRRFQTGELAASSTVASSCTGNSFTTHARGDSDEATLPASSAPSALPVSGLSQTQQSGPAPEGLWSAAWKGFEAASAVPSDSGQHPSTQSLRDKLLGRSSLSSSPVRRRQDLKQVPSSHQADASLQRPRLSLQGIAPAARLQLLSCSLAALESQIVALPDTVGRASESEWSAVMAALLESCSAIAAQGWLGYALPGLAQNATASTSEGVLGEVPSTDAPIQLTSAAKASPAQQQSDGGGWGADSASMRSAVGLQSDEKAAIHAAIVSFLRFPQSADGAETLHSSQEGDLGSSEGDVADRKASNDAASTSAASAGSMREQALARLMHRRETGSGAMTTGSRAAEDVPTSSGAVTPVLLRRGAAIIQDMAVIIAETVAESYLADAGLARGGTPGGAGLRVGSWPLHLHRRISSTRSLERFRNQVALQQWLERNFGSVTAMYEDRHELWGWDHRGRLFRRMLPARRAQEVERLKGLRYAHSLGLEAVDVAAPLLQRLLGRLGDAVSWLLVRLIGRSLGLIYRGVRESLSPRGRNASGDKSPSPQLDGV